MKAPAARATVPVLSGSILDKEILLENLAVEEGVARYRRLVAESMERGDGAALKPVERLLLHWYEPLVAVIKHEQSECKRGKPGKGGRSFYAESIQRISAEKLAVLTMHEMVGICLVNPGGVKVVKLANAVGRAAMAQIGLKLAAKEAPDAARHMRRTHDQSPRNLNRIAKRSLNPELWAVKRVTTLGAFLAWSLKNVASSNSYYDELFKEAFVHYQRQEPRRMASGAIRPIRIGMMRLDEAVFRIIEDGHATRQFLRPRYLPMIVKPYKWSKDAQGGYVRIRTPFISKPTRSQKKALADADLTRVYGHLDDVCDTPWSINTRVLSVVEEMFKAGGGMLEVPSRDDAPTPPIPEGDEEPEVRLARKREAHRIHDENKDMRGRRAEFLRKLDIAHRMRRYDRFWFPHQLCFRGRCYPVPPHLNHQGNDVCRGILQLGDAVDAGTDEGRFWLRVHAANCYGLDKVPFASRVGWVEDNMARIERAAADPLGDEWWQQAEEPWQFLAACIALVDPDAAARLPIQQDGTCNGLQHYAALGRDARAAGSVNLVPSDAPNSVYFDVLRCVTPIVERDAAAGNEFAKLVLPHLDKDMVKQNVMTKVYGVTVAGARKQVLGRLTRLGVQNQKLYQAANYMADVTMSAIGAVCTGAEQIMDWLCYCAREIACKPTLQPVRWTSPIGLPIVQPYRRWARVTVRTVIQSVALTVDDDTVPVSHGRQQAGVAPNFIHSIDASHMFMTATRCRERGIAFAGRHDGYITHAAHGGVLAATLREEFVALHERPILTDLRDEWRRLYPETEIPDPPKPGTFDLRSVLVSQYFFC